jgi:succinyl-CoA synthetase beta subunit
MKLFEYQAKDVFKQHGINVPNSVLAANTEEVQKAIEKVGFPCVLKSQVLSGGRGKAGLIRVAANREEALNIAKSLFESRHNVYKILVEEAVNIEKEIYLSITIDPEKAKALVIASAEGGVDIESLAANSPEKIIMEPVDIVTGIQGFQCQNVAYSLGVDAAHAKQITKIIASLYAVFKKYDAELVEINPLFITKEGDVIAGDGKLMIDDNSMYRQADYDKSREYYDSDVEFEAAGKGIPYIQFDGDISLMCAGAGLTTTVYDLINYAGGTVANYLEFGGPNYRRAEESMELCLKNDSKVILIVTFGTIARADVMAEGIVNAINKLKPDRPIVTCIRGTNEKEAVRMLKSAGLEPLFDTEEAVAKAVSISKGGN